jgi:hypothetical protein
MRAAIYVAQLALHQHCQFTIFHSERPVLAFAEQARANPKQQQQQQSED